VPSAWDFLTIQKYARRVVFFGDRSLLELIFQKGLPRKALASRTKPPSNLSSASSNRGPGVCNGHLAIHIQVMVSHEE